MSATLSFDVDFPSGVNLSNTNATALMDAVGLNYDFQNSPDINLNLFEEKVISFLANHGPHSPIHKAQDPIQIGNFIDLGRRENYLIQKAWQLISVIRDAKKLGATLAFWT